MLKLSSEKFVLSEYLKISFGVILLAIGLDQFLIPNQIAAGGVSGIATVLFHLTHFPVGISVLLMNILLFLAGFWVLGGGFGMKSIYATLLLSGMIDLFHYAAPFGQLTPLTNDRLMAVIFGDLLTGVGLAMVFNQDASTGGTDILARLLNKYTALDMGKALLVFDFAIAAAAGIFLHSIDIAMYSLLAVLINTLAVDEFIGTINNRKSVLIISRYPEEILHRIVNELGRGATILHGMGAYERREQKVILTVVTRRQMIQVRNIVRDIDPKGFVIITTVNEVLGEGFRENAL
jgi:uncharacterized membrane-anchored protein YitT (DUF2179 family)